MVPSGMTGTPRAAGPAVVGVSRGADRATTEDDLRRQIVQVAAELFAEHGYSGTKVGMVAERAGVTPKVVRRLTGGRAELFALAIASQATSSAAARVASAAAHPAVVPPLAVLIETSGQILGTPQLGWSVLELEALIQSRRDDGIRALESTRLDERRSDLEAVLGYARHAGGLDDDVDDAALVHFALALSVGLAVLDPVSRPPGRESWNALMARIGESVAPTDQLMGPGYEVRRPWRLRIDIPDRAGALARLARAMSTLHAYIVGTAVLASGDGERTVEVAVTVPENVTSDVLLAAAMSAGSNVHMTEGSVEDGLDVPTQVLDVATELVRHPGSAPLAAAGLVQADRFEVTDATEGADDAAGVLRLQWTPDRHVVLHRDWAPFAWAEQTRASAMLRLASAIAHSQDAAEAIGWVEPVKNGGTVWIRLGRPEDADAVAAMHERCTEQTRYYRYLTGVSQWRDLSLRRLAGGHRGATLVVMSQHGSIVGLGNVFPAGADDGDAAELAEIIEDAYQGLGIGTRLLGHMLELAQRLGFKNVVATVLAENTVMLAVLEATGLDWTRERADAVLTMRAPLPEAVSGSVPPGRRASTGADRATASGAR